MTSSAARSRYIASDYGMKLPILRSNPEDQILYQTERYNEETFGYEVPIKEEGDYVLVLKFAEVYFAQSQQKVFDVRVNGHVVVKDLDIFDRVGHSTAHDEIIPISIKKGKLSVQGEVSTFTGKLNIEFVKVTTDPCIEVSPSRPSISIVEVHYLDVVFSIVVLGDGSISPMLSSFLGRHFSSAVNVCDLCS
ncbi:hypothetical protein JD844_014998 [Phrynosoma platyrhinos]|uniref:Malectin domain-containing protein n=1 Tax=Phrynosoma platyrhinos TaxID=52577 RepID=A0ABQ7T797_PHRPL|nr:hypothetical protein JD844_014998 [Phrynosoma platyrhinos]